MMLFAPEVEDPPRREQYIYGKINYKQNRYGGAEYVAEYLLFAI